MGASLFSRVGIITQARFGSIRLPGKVLKCVGPKTLLQYHVERLLETGLPVVVATTEEETDNSIVKVCSENRFSFFRGNTLDVLDRFYKCAVHFDFHTVIRVTADCPLVDGRLILEGLRHYQEWNEPRGYLSNTVNRTFPRGFDFEVFSVSLLKEAHEKANTSYEREHVTPYIEKNKSGLIEVRSFEQSVSKARYRLTVDEIQDLEAVSKLIVDFNAAKLSHEEITRILEEHPEIVRLNSKVTQKKEQ